MRGYALIPIFFLFVAPTSAYSQNLHSTAGQELKILTLNFADEDVTVDTDYVIRDRRLNGLIDWVTQNQPDVIFIQEGFNYRNFPSVAIPLAQAIGYDYFYRIVTGAPFLLYDSNAVLAKKNFNLSEEQIIKLPHTAFHIGDGKTWILSFGTGTYAVGGTVTLGDGSKVYVYSAHLQGSLDSDHLDQMQALDSAIRGQLTSDEVPWESAHVIIAGDLNSVPGSLPLQYVEKSGYTDLWSAVHPNDPGFSSCTNPLQPNFNPVSLGGGRFPSEYDHADDARIDHIYFHGSDLMPLASTLVFTAPYEGAWMSDHYGLQGVFQIGGLPQTVPNPVLDSDGLPNPTVVRISDDVFNCSDDQPCASLPDMAVLGPRGMAVYNDSHMPIEIELSGKGRIFTSPTAHIKPGEAASFYFDATGDYQLSVNNGDHPATGTVSVLKSLLNF